MAVVLTGITFFLTKMTPEGFQRLDAMWTDQYFKKRGTVDMRGSDVVLITIDEKSLTKLGRWPWPRSVMAKAIDALHGYELKSLGFDITFSENSSEDSILKQSLHDFQETYLGYFFYTLRKDFEEAALSEKEMEENDAVIFPSRLSFSSKQMEESGRQVFGLQSNVPEIAAALPKEAQGFFNVFPDPDGVVRKMPLALFYKGGVYPSLSLQLASHAKDFSAIPTYNEDGNLNGLVLGDIKVPVSPSGEFFINYRGPSKTIPHISIADIIDGTISQETLKGKIGIMGATAVGIYDLRVTPVAPNYPGLEIQGTVVDNLLRGDYLVQNETTRAISFFMLIGSGILLGILLPLLRAVFSSIFFLLIAGLIAFSGYYFFSQKLMIVYTMVPLFNTFFVFGTITLYRYFTEERKRRQIRKTFQHYLSPAVIKQVLRDPEKLKLGGSRQELAILFSDIRNFTGNSEKLSPEAVVNMLNDYLTEMNRIVFQYEGTVDKYIGDAVMAFWGAPLPITNPALKAAYTALDMVACVHQYEKAWCDKHGFEQLRIGIGLHIGPMAVGNMGSAKRFNYTVIGDSVNLGARLESLNKEYGTEIIISDSLYQQIKDHVETRELGSVKVKGKEEPTTIYELLGRK